MLRQHELAFPCCDFDCTAAGASPPRAFLWLAWRYNTLNKLVYAPMGKGKEKERE